MTNCMRHRWIALTGGVLAYSPQFGVRRASAHNGPHGDTAEPAAAANEIQQPQTSAPSEHHLQTSETAEVEKSIDPDEVSASPPPSPNMKKKSADETIQVIPPAPKAPALSKASLSEEFSVGLGESLLGLLIAGPFLLLSLKKQLQP